MEVNYFTILYWFCHTWTLIHHRYTHVPHPEPPSLFLHRTITLDRPSAPAPSIQYHASNLDWQFVSYMILYMFQCHSPESSDFSKSTSNSWMFMVHVLLKPGLENFKHYFTSVWDKCNCAVVWAFFGIAFLWDWNENWPFPVLWPLLSFPNLLAYWVRHFHSISFRI